MKYLIIGGVAGGATTAARLRRNDETAEIILFEKGKYVSYANCGLPYYIGGTIQGRDDLFVQTPEGFKKRFNIDIRTEQEVISINKEKKTILINDHNGKEYNESYDKLVLSPGADPIRPDIEGINSKRIFTLRNVDDTDSIKQYAINNHPKKAIILGAGFIGVELCENLHESGINVTIIDKTKQVLPTLDFSMASIVHNQLTDHGVELILNDSIKKIEDTGNEIIAHLESGKSISSDIMILCLGVNPEIKLAKEAGLKIGELGGIKVNKHMQTSDESIYALGDAVEIIHGVTGKPALIPLAGPANKQGRIVADNIVYGNKESYNGTIGTTIAKVHDLTVASAGTNAKTLIKENIPYISSFTHSASHAGYYPGSIPLSIKIIFCPTDGRLYGAQVVGETGVDKRIEMLAQVIQRKGTVYDLASLEHAYAPPYSSAKDPVNIAGSVAENILTGKMKIINWKEISSLPEDTILLDVRTPLEHNLGTIPGSVNIPLEILRERIDELPKDKDIVIFCTIGMRGYIAYRLLFQKGFTRIRNLSGGYKTWNTI